MECTFILIGILLVLTVLTSACPSRGLGRDATYLRRATTRAAEGTVQRRERSQTPAHASTQAAAAAPSVLPTGAPTASARPMARTSARFTWNQTRTRRKNNLTRRTPRRT